MFVTQFAHQTDPVVEQRHSGKVLSVVRNVLAFVGLILIVVAAVLAPKLLGLWSQVQEFDDMALPTFRMMGEKLLTTGNPAEATVWRVAVAPGLSAAEVEDVMDSVAGEHNLKRVGESQLFSDEHRDTVVTLAGIPYRFSKTLMYCNSLIAAKMFNQNMAYSAFTPCRITVIEDGEGRLWLYTLNIDMMIYGGKPLPDGLKQDALAVRDGIRDIMQRAATGEF